MTHLTPLDSILSLCEVGLVTCAAVFAITFTLWAIRKVGR